MNNQKTQQKYSLLPDIFHIGTAIITVIAFWVLVFELTQPLRAPFIGF